MARRPPLRAEVANERPEIAPCSGGSGSGGGDDGSDGDGDGDGDGRHEITEPHNFAPFSPIVHSVYFSLR